MRFWYWDYKDKETCNPCTLDYDSILRGDNIILRTKEDIIEICWKCSSVDDCVWLLRQAKTDLYSKKYNGTDNTWTTRR